MNLKIRMIMGIPETIYQDAEEYARLLRGRSNRTGIIIDLTLFFYTHEELQELGTEHIHWAIDSIMEVL